MIKYENADVLQKGILLELQHPIRGWPVKGADTLAEAADIIFGSPFREIPRDTYQIIDRNETYSLVAVVDQSRVSRKKRYLALNADLAGNSKKKRISLEKNKNKTIIE